MLTGKLVGYRMTSDNGIVCWREEFRILETLETLINPVLRQTAPEIGFSAPVDLGDTPRYRELLKALRSQIGTIRSLETAVYREWWRDPLPG